MKGHSAVGARIVGHVSELAALVPMIRHHHERYDGSGYPDRLKGEDIPIGARIIAIADAYDTMTTQRPDRELVSHEEACEELRRCSGTQFDPELVEMCVWLQVRPPAGPRPPRPEPCSSEVEVQQAQAALSL